MTSNDDESPQSCLRSSSSCVTSMVSIRFHRENIFNGQRCLPISSCECQGLLYSFNARAHHSVSSTGATGYIGGDALYELMKRHADDYQVAALVRNSDKGAQIASQYPNIRLVYGDLDSAETLQEEARKADIVLRILPAVLPTMILFFSMFFADCTNSCRLRERGSCRRC